MTILLRNIGAISILIYVLATVYSSPILHRTKRWEEFPNVTFNFDCTDRPIGFYADEEFKCQIFHMCDEAGRRVPYMCPNDTAFNQMYRICDWQTNFACDDAPKWFYLNEMTYATDPPKIESEESVIIENRVAAPESGSIENTGYLPTVPKQ